MANFIINPRYNYLEIINEKKVPAYDQFREGRVVNWSSRAEDFPGGMFSVKLCMFGVRLCMFNIRLSVLVTPRL